MNDEIREILEILKKCYDLKNENFDSYISLYQLGLLLDYITKLEQINKNQAKRNSRQRLANQKQQELILKLQQENERLKGRIEFLEDINSDQYAKIEELEQENERLKNEPLTNKLDRIDSVVANIYRNNKEKNDYKSRCLKAVEYIENNTHYYSTAKHGEGFVIDNENEEEFCNDLLNILQNGDSNEVNK